MGASVGPPASSLFLEVGAVLKNVLGLVMVCGAVASLATSCSATDGSTLEDDGNSGNGAGSNTGGSTGSFGSGGNSGSGGFEGCGEATFGNEIPGAMLIVLDTSGSMSDNDKYGATATAINAMINTAAPSTEMGLLAYPEGNFDDFALVGCINEAFINGVVSPQCQAVLDDSGCQDVALQPHVAIAPLQQSGGPINSWLSQNGPTGNTPTRHALINAYNVLASYQTQGQKFALLMTDGVPTVHTPAMPPLPDMAANCGTMADIESEVLNASQNGIATFVIGAPGSEGAAAFLSQLAVNGNTPKDPNCSPGAGDCHYQIGSANFQQELEQVLSTIAGVISDCIFDLPQGEEVDPNLVNVTIDTPNGPVDIYKDPTHQDGWDYTDGSQTKIQLFGPACELYKQQQGTQITIILGCPTNLK